MNQILLVEGINDLHVFSNIFEKHQVNGNFKIIDKDGDGIYKSIPIYIKTDISTIGIVIDADIDIEQKWEKLKGIITNAGYIPPTKLDYNGLIIEKDNLPRLGIWIMPNNNEKGMLEDFIKHLIPKDDLLLKHVNDSLNKIEKESLNKYKAIHKAKARIHTWLAWQETPGTPMGLAIKKTYLNTNNELCLLFVKWINKLYN